MAVSQKNNREVWITGIGLVSSLGEGLDAHWQALNADDQKPIVDAEAFAPYPIHPICEIDFSTQIPKRGDLRQMEDWQRIGTYAAGLALDDAGIKGDEDLLAKTHIIAAAGNGERDPLADATVLEAIKGDLKWRERLNDLLLTNLRPTLYLAQQTQLLAGNISIVHKVTGGSRTYKGEEIAGVQVIENAVQRIKAGQGDVFLVGAANNAARWDLLLIRSMNGLAEVAMGSMGAFLVIESAEHARQRGAKPYARIAELQVSSSKSKDSAVPDVKLKKQDGSLLIEDLSTLVGHGIEAQFPMGVALASLACSKEKTSIVLTGLHMGVGEGEVLLEGVEV